MLLCAIFKNEAHVLSEWIQHYLQLGVEHIHLINDHSTDEYEPILAAFEGRVTLHQNDVVYDTIGRQEQILESFMRPLLPTTDWVMTLDLDEFLYSTEDLKTVLDAQPAEIAQILVPWVHFGSSGHRLQPYSVVTGFTRCAKGEGRFNSHKSIARAATVEAFRVHQHVVRGETVCSDVLRINHYNVQSHEFYMGVKATRGDVNRYFDALQIQRDEALFAEYDRNEDEDTRLALQSVYDPMIGRTWSGGEHAVTLVITSCHRPHLLACTLASFVEQNTYPIERTLILDDSGQVGCNEEAVAPYREMLRITTLYHETNQGQIAAIDRLYSYVRTPWIFHCEEDWVFLQPQFIEKSMRVFEENPQEQIYTVWLRPQRFTSDHPIEWDDQGRGYHEMSRVFSYLYLGETYTWCGVTFNPGLRRTRDMWRFHPYALRCDKETLSGRVGEYSVNARYREAGYYSMILDDPAGYVDHIGGGEHIKREWE